MEWVAESFAGSFHMETASQGADDPPDRQQLRDD